MYRALCDVFQVDSQLGDVAKRCFSSLLDSQVSRPMQHHPVFDMGELVARIKFQNKFPNSFGAGAKELVKLRDRTLLLCAIATFARAKDLVGLRLDSIQRREEALRVVLWHTKTDKARNGIEAVLPFAEDQTISSAHFVLELAGRLRCLVLDQPPQFLFGYAQHGLQAPLGPDRVRNLLRNELCSLGVPYPASSIRPSATSFALINGMDPYSVQKQGHWDTLKVMKDHYDHTTMAATLWMKQQSAVMRPDCLPPALPAPPLQGEQAISSEEEYGSELEGDAPEPDA